MALVAESTITISVTRFHKKVCLEHPRFASRERRGSQEFLPCPIISNKRDNIWTVWHDWPGQMMENKPEKRILGFSWSLLAILLFGTALRLLNLGRQSVWVDEGFSWLAVQLSFGDVTRLSWTDVHPRSEERRVGKEGRSRWSPD